MNIEFFPSSERAKLYPPVPVKKAMPEWYRDLDSNVSSVDVVPSVFKKNGIINNFSVKKCAPVQDYVTSGYSLRLSCDVILSQRKEQTDLASLHYRVPDDGVIKLIGMHHHQQLPIPLDGLKKHYIKFYSEWVIKTPPGYSCLIYPNFYQFEDRFTMLPAIIDTDTHDAAIGIIGYINGNQDTDFLIKAGTPMVTVFPYKREKWQMKTHEKLYDEEKESKLRMYRTSMFAGIYKKLFHSKKAYD